MDIEAKHVEADQNGARIAELNEEVARLRKCVYTSFNEGEDFEAMVGYNH